MAYAKQAGLEKKREKAVKMLVADPEIPVGQALKHADYSESSIKASQRIATGLGFRALLEKYLPDTMLVSRHSELVQSDNEDTALKAVKLGYQLKGHLEEQKQALALEVNFSGSPDGVKLADSVDTIDIKVL